MSLSVVYMFFFVFVLIVNRLLALSTFFFFLIKIARFLAKFSSFFMNFASTVSSASLFIYKSSFIRLSIAIFFNL